MHPRFAGETSASAQLEKHPHIALEQFAAGPAEGQIVVIQGACQNAVQTAGAMVGMNYSYHPWAARCLYKQSINIALLLKQHDGCLQLFMTPR